MICFGLFMDVFAIKKKPKQLNQVWAVDCISFDYWLDFVGRNLHLLDVAISGFTTIKVACDLFNLCTYPLGIFVKLFNFGNLGRNKLILPIWRSSVKSR